MRPDDRRRALAGPGPTAAIIAPVFPFAAAPSAASLAPQAAVAIGVIIAVGALLFYLTARNRQTEEDDLEAVGYGAPSSREEVDREARRQFAHATASIFVMVAAADGDLQREEVRAVRDFFEGSLGYDEIDLAGVREELEAALREIESWHADATTGQTEDMVELACERARTAMTPPVRTLLLRTLYRVAGADGEVSKKERAVIADVARRLGVDPAAHRAVVMSVLGEDSKDYELLGVDASSSDDEVKSAFRKRAAEVHPDKVSHLGPAAVEEASRTFQQLREAYDRIRSERGL